MINNCKEIRVPIEIMNVRNLTITQKVLLSQIAGLDNKEGCFATNSYFAELFNLSKEEILAIIDPQKFVGRAPSQVVEFIEEYVEPIIKENKDALDIKSEINV